MRRLALLVALLAACTPREPAEEEDAGPEYPLATCALLLECVRAADDATGTLGYPDTRREYGAEGECWEREQDPVECELRCSGHLSVYQQEAPQVEECQVDELGVITRARACWRLEECLADQDAGPVEERFAEDGSCWRFDELAESCRLECEEQLLERGC